MTEELKMAEGPTCACEAAIIGLYACSGGSNVGQMANRAAVELTKQGRGKIMCTVGIGGNVSGIIKSAEGTDEIIAIDGCPLLCARKSLERAGFTVGKNIVITELGMKKGGSLDLEENDVKEMMTKVEAALSN
ncbi:putative zinc-binding protein [Methanohalophilus mahii]|uniref:DGC domain protein n=1 Tax=Methanohalophilus mahii (strain ATCC 35705 / DSM 5219 / SLP) TaxID=547558 RepID=D5E6K0_METMS|nr:putative zinc-binding protein [Methanohalophilus mahii]ADE36788.1 DGC domain protein [Methanohalophilus mahii DSM 5219]